jgi:hypothetical protein
LGTNQNYRKIKAKLIKDPDQGMPCLGTGFGRRDPEYGKQKTENRKQKIENRKREFSYENHDRIRYPRIYKILPGNDGGL